ncbi:GNAT family N-acetyltransferase [Paenisporosarcina quisquiliarum]|uniref:GNAT family N-acetyltransferase n=1 Tax=Paenisporosarcina quisquiliarum TaxID=365346 RepID=A0A9X3LH49_9BACL|nr:GNAT family N-acetyltransferase [Paenisporosarcina quisquiliarum]MCZ8537597.1 GNAT family N-acetyltransferase [Paenisporosarcina quisquiliarum]
MIKKIFNMDLELAHNILSIQRPSYQIEADLIGFQGIPALSETVDDIMDSKETFIGYYEDDQLLGVLSYEENEDFVDICRLVVSPASFRKGIGRQLVSYIVEEIRGSRDVIVSTGLKNTPAVTLYEKLGFQQERTMEIAPGVHIVNMRYHHIQ